MAEDTRDASAQAAATTATPPRKLPKGMVLGPDGKPCRTCTTLSDFTSQRRVLSTQTPSPLSRHTADAQLSNCPPDVEVLGRSSWTLLHSLAAAYPSAPSAAQKTQMRSFVGLFAQLYPCWTCRDDFVGYMEREEVRVGSREEFGRWMCEAHNEVNRKLGKGEFDCRRWEERWKGGWRDGSCG